MHDFRAACWSAGSLGLACAALALAASAFAPLNAAAQEGIFFSRDFPGSGPPYFEVEVRRDGAALYREKPDEEDPVEFTLTPAEVTMVFGLVEKLDYFRREVASDRKVAFTGDKRLRYVSSSGEVTETKFVFTEDKDALTLATWFLRAGESERHRIELERVFRFDHLGVNKALLRFQTSLDKDRIVAAHQFLPILKKIAARKKLVHMARARAAALVDRIEGNAGAGY